MNTKWILLGSLFTVLTLALAVGWSQAEGPQPPDQEDEMNVEASAVGDVVPIQGRLTNASGNPLNGTYSITASLYTQETGGTALCADTDNVAVTNGLFNMLMNFCTPLDISGEQLYLGIKVGSDTEMVPRRAIYPIPYAWTVRPGAIIKGADSFVFVPGTAMVKNNDDDSTRWDMRPSGAVRIYRGDTAGDKVVYFTIILPSVLYGQPIKVTNMTIFYECQDGTKNYIDSTFLYKQILVDNYQSLIANYVHQTSNTATTYDLAVPDPNNVLTASQGILALHLNLHFVDDTNYIEIGGIRFTISHNY